ncbi:MAG TPA: substrate-binding domain-containing protein [Acidimicrobiales bacterium]|nr:substrate-binding domain-containing protein [Acidimicrobiales bacterium]
MARRGWWAVAAVVLTITGACTTANTRGSDSSDLGDPGSCTVVDMAVSPEKIDLIVALAKSFNGTKQARIDGNCIFVRPQKKSSGAAAQLLYTNWNESTDGPKPVVWSPAAGSWGQIVNQRLSEQGQQAIVGTGDPFMVTPLVIAMPKPMADALGYPAKPVGWSDIFTLATDPRGWGAVGHPEFGPFKLGKTNPNFSTSGLNELIAQTYAASKKTTGLSQEDLDKPDVVAFGTGIESSVVHYGDTTLTFLNNWYRADQRSSSLNYVSAVAVEEKSVIDYNQGNPDGILDPGEQPRPPKIPLVAIYPKEGTLFSDSPFFTLNAPWVSQQEKDAAKVFEDFVKQPENQQQVLKFNFRPGNPAVAIGDPITAANGVDPNQPQTLLEVPQPRVLTSLLDKWEGQRKKAQVTLVLDVSGSMGDPASPSDDAAGTKLDLAKQAIHDSIALFSPNDILGFDIFSTGLGPNEDQKLLEVIPPGRVADNGEKLQASLNALSPFNDTPLYEVTKQAYQNAVASFDPTRINAVVLLTDGKNDDGNASDDQRQLQDLLNTLRSGNEGQQSHAVRVFPIAYGADADSQTLKAIADASSSTFYSATNATTISQVLTAVISNF